eukprot:gene9963-10118_t
MAGTGKDLEYTGDHRKFNVFYKKWQSGRGVCGVLPAAADGACNTCC